MPPDDRVRLRHMIEAAELALNFVAGRQREDLDSDPMLRLALTRAIEIIGEAASRVSEDGQAAASAVPWPRIVAMRNRLIHGYFDIDHDILWHTATENVPALLALLRDVDLDD